MPNKRTFFEIHLELSTNRDTTDLERISRLENQSLAELQKTIERELDRLLRRLEDKGYDVNKLQIKEVVENV